MDIRCDTCGAIFRDLGKATENSARVKGWGIWRGKTHGGDEVELKICPTCRDDRRRGSRADRLAQPPGSVPLF